MRLVLKKIFFVLSTVYIRIKKKAVFCQYIQAGHFIDLYRLDISVHLDKATCAFCA